MKTPTLEQIIEAILFVAGEPQSLETLAAVSGMDQGAVKAALTKLRNNLQERGVVLIETGDTYLLSTAPSAAMAVELFLGLQIKPDLTKPTLETLAIIAYKQPIKKSEIDEVRGVSSEQTIKNLLLRGLITEYGHAQEPGKPILYATSSRFLQHLGLQHTGQLPKLGKDVGDAA